MVLARRVAAALIMGAVVALAGCGGDDPGAAPASTASAPAPSAATPGPGGPASGDGPTATRLAPAAGPTWTSGRVTVVHKPAVPPVPVLTGVRSSAHQDEGYDRIVFDFRGALPGYDIRYVSQVRADPSDRPVSVPGRRFLLIVFRPAQAHEDSGAATVSGSRRLDLPMLRGYAVAGDFEGVLSIALGLDDVVGYRVGELPGRIYVDVAA